MATSLTLLIMTLYLYIVILPRSKDLNGSRYCAHLMCNPKTPKKTIKLHPTRWGHYADEIKRYMLERERERGRGRESERARERVDCAL